MPNYGYELFAGLLIGNERNKLNRSKSSIELRKLREKRDRKRKALKKKK